MIRQPVVAGQFYPADAGALQRTVLRYVDVPVPAELSSGCTGLVVPHAGYVYSGSVAGAGYACFARLDKSCHYTVVVLAPSHRVYFEGAALPEADVFRTPLGDVQVAPESLKLAEGRTVLVADQAHALEHAVEVQLPFLQMTLHDFSIIPLVLGEVDTHILAQELLALRLQHLLVVASSDLSHYSPYPVAVEHDHATVEHILHGEGDVLGGEDACGFMPIRTLLEMAAVLDWRSRLILYRNSGDTAGDKSAVVGYASIGFQKGGS